MSSLKHWSILFALMAAGCGTWSPIAVDRASRTDATVPQRRWVKAERPEEFPAHQLLSGVPSERIEPFKFTAQAPVADTDQADGGMASRITQKTASGLFSSGSPVRSEDRVSYFRVHNNLIVDRPTTAADPGNATVILADDLTRTSAEQDRPVSMLALVAFACTILGMSIGAYFGPAWFLVPTGFVLGIIALATIKKRNESGAGLAIVAIALPLALLVLILIALNNWSGWS